MLDMQVFGHELDKYGFNFYSGVPCSFLKSMINYSINKDQYIMSANEGDAVAICAGAELGGKRTIFLCQNSGLTNAISPLSSLNKVFKIPVLGFVSLRGEKDIGDEPQHELMGKITGRLLDTMEIENEVLSNSIETAKHQLERANKVLQKGEPFFFIVKKGTLGPVELDKQSNVNQKSSRIDKLSPYKDTPKRIEVLEEVQNHSDSTTIILATTGVTGRELYELEDKENQLYMVGSMGCVSSMGLGLALARPDKKIIVIDGDGAFLMRMGAITTNAYYAPNNLYHLLLDNGIHESTGGQATVSQNVDYIKIVEGAKYPRIQELGSIRDLKISLKKWKEDSELTFGYLKTSPGIKKNLARPKVKPYEVKERLINFISGERI